MATLAEDGVNEPEVLRWAAWSIYGIEREGDEHLVLGQADRECGRTWVLATGRWNSLGRASLRPESGGPIRYVLEFERRMVRGASGRRPGAVWTLWVRLSSDDEAQWVEDDDGNEVARHVWHSEAVAQCETTWASGLREPAEESRREIAGVLFVHHFSHLNRHRQDTLHSSLEGDAADFVHEIVARVWDRK